MTAKGIKTNLGIEGAINGGTTAGTSTVYTLAIDDTTFDSLVDNTMFTVEFHTDSGASPTLNINSTGAKAIVDRSGTAIGAGDIVSTGKYVLIYDLDNDRYVANDVVDAQVTVKEAAIQVIGQDDVLTTGDGKAVFRISPEMIGMDLTNVYASTTTVSTSGTPTVQIARGRLTAPGTRSFVDMLSTPVTIDINEFDSKDATTPAVINTANDDIADGDIIRVDVDVAGTGTTGLYVTLVFQLP